MSNIKKYQDWLSLNEYDREGFDNKYQNLPTDRAEKINKYSIERQKINGIKMVRKDKPTDIHYITPTDINDNWAGCFRFEFDRNELAEVIDIGDKLFKYITFNVRNIVDGQDGHFQGKHTDNYTIKGYLIRLSDDGEFKYSIDSIKSEADYIPQTPKDNITFLNRIKSILLEKYSNKGGKPYITEVQINRNAFYR